MRKIRNRYLFFAIVPLWFCSFGATMQSGAQIESRLIDFIYGGGFVFAVCYVGSMGGMFSFVGLSPERLVIRNPGRRFAIPWEKVQEVVAENGLDIKVEGYSEPIYSFAFLGSFLGMFTGGTRAKRVAAKIDAYREGRTGDGPVIDEFPWRAHALWIGVGWTLFSVVGPLIGWSSTL